MRNFEYSSHNPMSTIPLERFLGVIFTLIFNELVLSKNIIFIKPESPKNIIVHVNLIVIVEYSAVYFVIITGRRWFILKMECE